MVKRHYEDGATTMDLVQETGIQHPMLMSGRETQHTKLIRIVALLFGKAKIAELIIPSDRWHVIDKIMFARYYNKK